MTPEKCMLKSGYDTYILASSFKQSLTLREEATLGISDLFIRLVFFLLL